MIPGLSDLKCLMKEKNIIINDLKLAYFETGTEKKPKLLCIHGWLDNAASFFKMMPFLQEHFHIFLLELPGHGHSEHLGKSSHYHLLDSITWIEDFRRKLNLDQINFCCHSLGGVLAGLYAASFPENVNFLFSIEALGPISAPEKMAPESLRKYTKLYLSQKQKERKNHPSIDSCIAARIRDGGVSREDAALIVDRGVLEKKQGYQWTFDRKLQLSSPLRMTEKQVQSFLAAIECPYHLVVADTGISILQNVLSERSKLVKNLKIHSMTGGHHVHMEKPEELCHILLDVFPF